MFDRLGDSLLRTLFILAILGGLWHMIKSNSDEAPPLEPNGNKQPIKPLSGVISAGSGHYILALDEDGHLYGWGNNASKQLGSTDYPALPVPTIIDDEIHWRHVHAGTNHSYAIDHTGRLWRRPYNQQGFNQRCEESNPTKKGQYRPVDTQQRWVKAESNLDSVVGLDENNSLWLWQDSNDECSAQDEANYGIRPTLVSFAPDMQWSDFCVAEHGVLAISTEGQIWWKSLRGSISDQPAQRLDSPEPAVMAFCNSSTRNVVYLDQQHQLWSFTRSDPPTQASLVSTRQWAAVSLREYSTTYAIATNGTLWTFPDGLGADNLNQEKPFGSPAIRWTSLTSGRDFSAGLTHDGKIYTWGRNQHGVLGNASPVRDVEKPTLMDSSTPWMRESP